MTTIILVHGATKNDKTAAEQLNAFMSTDDTYECAVWDEKNFNVNKVQVGSSHPVIFIGKTDVSKAIEPIINWKYTNINMKYGWYGKEAIICVDPHNFIKEEMIKLKKDLEGFKKETDSQVFKTKFGNIAAGTFLGSLSGPLLSVILPVEGILLFGANLLAAVATGKIVYEFGKNKKRDDNLIVAEYSLLIYKFFNEGIHDFLEGK